MSAKTIMLIRHAERPIRNTGGVDIHGREDKHSLVPVGWQRAGALALLFSDPPEPLVRPDHLYAASAALAKDSRRPIETITPLAQRLGLTIDSQFGKGQESAMVRAVLACKGAVLIAWQHEAIAEIAKLVATGRTYPKWSASCYDMVWTFTRHHDTYRFSIIPQMLLGGDSSRRRS